MLRLPEDRKEAEKLLMALVRLSSNNDFKRIHDFFIGCMDELMKANRDEKNDITFRWNQGAIQALVDQHHYMLNARTLVEKYRTYKI